jgi:hypothetical protein
LVAEVSFSSTDRLAVSRLRNTARYASVAASECCGSVQMQSLFAGFAALYFGACVFPPVLQRREIAAASQTLFQHSNSKHISDFACVVVCCEKFITPVRRSLCYGMLRAMLPVFISNFQLLYIFQ